MASPYSVGIGDLRSDVTVQSDQLQKWLVQNTFHRFGGVAAGECEAELLVVDPGRHRGMAVDVDVGGDPDQHPLRPAHFAGEVGDLHERVDDDAADADRGGVVSSSTDFALPCMTIRAGSTPAASAVASSPPELDVEPAPSSATQRATSVVSSALAAYTISTLRSVVR